MNLVEVYPIILNALKNLDYQSVYVANSGDTPYQAKNLKQTRELLRSIEIVPFIEEPLNAILNSWLFADFSDSKLIASTDNSFVQSYFSIIKIKLSTLKDIVERTNLVGKEDLLFVRLPDLSTFDDLSKASLDLKKAIEIPIMDNAINGEVKILAGDHGSVILYVALGTVLAVKLVAGICWAAAVIKQKRAEAKLFEAHAKTLDLKNEALQILIEAQSQQLKNLLNSEAEAIALKHYSHNDPETIERLKLSIVSVADLVERGAKILPMNNDVDIQKSFPDYGGKGLIESGIKQLKENA